MASNKHFNIIVCYFVRDLFSNFSYRAYAAKLQCSSNEVNLVNVEFHPTSPGLLPGLCHWTSL